jgi:hypothetical protein
MVDEGEAKMGSSGTVDLADIGALLFRKSVWCADTGALLFRKSVWSGDGSKINSVDFKQNFEQSIDLLSRPQTTSVLAGLEPPN